MKNYNEFLNESSKFLCFEYVKRKKDGKIAKIEKICHPHQHVLINITEIKYLIRFDNNHKIYYSAKELEKPTKNEIDLILNIKKYNL